MMTEEYLTAQEAAEALGVSRATLYAYVSRGQIRSEPGGESARTRRYSGADVQRLKAQQDQRRSPGRAAEGALNGGIPQFDSALTLIAPGGLYYRGYDVLDLVGRCSAEQVAALLWLGDPPTRPAAIFADTTSALPPEVANLLAHVADLAPVSRFQALLPLASASDQAAYDLRQAAVARTGVRIVRLLTALFTGTEPGTLGIAQALQQRWAPKNPAAAGLFDQALVLCADHELNVSTFTARCAASARSTPYDVVSAGLAALHGIRHGGQTERVEALLREVGTPERAYVALAARLRRGESIPGFGHEIYIEGDPRSVALLGQLAATYPDAPTVALAQAIVRQTATLIGEHPSIDLALVALAMTLGMPPGSALALFAIGRSIGWVAHAIEEYAQGRLIRPRARYIGDFPEMLERR